MKKSIRRVVSLVLSIAMLATGTAMSVSAVDGVTVAETSHVVYQPGFNYEYTDVVVVPPAKGAADYLKNFIKGVAIDKLDLGDDASFDDAMSKMEAMNPEEFTALVQDVTAELKATDLAPFVDAVAKDYQEVMDAVKDEDVVLVLVNSFNPMTACVDISGGAVAEMSGAVDGLVAAVNAKIAELAATSDKIVVADTSNVALAEKINAAEVIAGVVSPKDAFKKVKDELPPEIKKAIDATVIPGAEKIVMGDLNNDGRVRMTDVVYLRMAAMADEGETFNYIAPDGVTRLPINLKAADVAQDGKINMVDAVVLQRYVAEIINELPVTDLD